MTRRSLYSMLVALVTAPFAKFAKPKLWMMARPGDMDPWTLAEETSLAGAAFFAIPKPIKERMRIMKKWRS